MVLERICHEHWKVMLASCLCFCLLCKTYFNISLNILLQNIGDRGREIRETIQGSRETHTHTDTDRHRQSHRDRQRQTETDRDSLLDNALEKFLNLFALPVHMLRHVFLEAIF